MYAEMQIHVQITATAYLKRKYLQLFAIPLRYGNGSLSQQTRRIEPMLG